MGRGAETEAGTSTLAARVSNLNAWASLGIADVDRAGDYCDRTSTRSIALGLCKTPDGDPIPGIVFQTDYKYEEEAGVGELRQAITSDDPRRFQMAPDAASHIAYFEDANALVISVEALSEHELRWGDPIRSGWSGSGGYGGYASDWTHRLKYIQGVDIDPHQSVAELRERAKALGVKPLPARKADLVREIALKLVPENPACWPADFNYGNHLVIRAEGDHPSARMVSQLIDAAKNGTLGLGSGSGPFSTGLFIYDTRHETPGLVEQREAEFDWHDEKMADLDPVKQKLLDEGMRFYFLGNPREISTDGGPKQIKYWLNGSGNPQPSGWYTLRELEDKKFIEDAKQRADERKRSAEIRDRVKAVKPGNLVEIVTTNGTVEGELIGTTYSQIQIDEESYPLASIEAIHVI